MNFRLTAKKIDTSNPNFAGVITFEAENKSDKDIRVYANSFDINGLALAQKAFDETVSAGATVEFECNIPDSLAELESIEITAEAFSGALFNSDRVTEETAPITIELK